MSLKQVMVDVKERRREHKQATKPEVEVALPFSSWAWGIFSTYAKAHDVNYNQKDAETQRDILVEACAAMVGQIETLDAKIKASKSQVITPDKKIVIAK